MRTLGAGELAPALPAVRYFVNVVPTGGPRLELVPGRNRFYTGEPVNPMVRLRTPDGWPDDVEIDLEIVRPTLSIGTLLARQGLQPPANASGDTIPARLATIAVLEQAAGGSPVGRTTETHTLADTPEATRGNFEGSATLGKELPALTTVEGHYQLHFRAAYGAGRCTGRRELLATLLVDVGVDAAHTPTTLFDLGPAPGGRRRGRITFVPGDRFGNELGPGRPEGLTLGGASGTWVTGPVVDNGDGSYTVEVVWDTAAGAPGLTVTQPDRPPVTPTTGGTTSMVGIAWFWVSWIVVAVLVVTVAVLAVLLARR